MISPSLSSHTITHLPCLLLWPGVAVRSAWGIPACAAIPAERSWDRSSRKVGTAGISLALTIRDFFSTSSSSRLE
ncbi:hypothetical protein Y1Q_0005699 [Alligator mississippiensis]|uniref:Secreted protein n=1 Tax=Alligator mississippiensis TaxID=8496 RepID=A0A151MFK1_ALLMI|nr:hypothetical protein Y1Q_0005699 [Alligator mississippiensis]